MELRRLEHFLTVTECGSFGRAASQLGMTQSGLTKSIQTLEKTIGVPLFIRHSRGVEPTKYGKSLAQHATPIGVHVKNALSDIEALKSGHAGSLNIGISPTWLMEDVLPRVIMDLVVDRPGLNLGLFSRVSSKELLETLRSGELDIIIGTEQVGISDENIEITYLTEDIHGVIVRKGHPILKHPSNSVSDFDRYGWIIREEGTLYRQRLEVLYMDQGRALPPPVIETNSIAFTLTSIASTDHLSVSRDADIKSLGFEGIEMLDFPFKWVRKVSVMRRRDAPLSDVGREFIQELVNTFAN
jgi:DNA-binding transcriptional LysR family regulator